MGGTAPPVALDRAQPVALSGEFTPTLSRWLWLVKWLLLIPHLVVLAFLWLAFFASTVAAFLVILVKARYPRTLFDFNVGVMRWTWRVAFYGHQTLASDRYPAFRLAAADDDLAHLDVAYPPRLSRGRALVKWWLLALPHYVILFGFTCLLGALTLCASISLLFTRAYPPGIFDLLVGVHRWAARVLAYVALMTDVYPPFRLDQGAQEPSSS